MTKLLIPLLALGLFSVLSSFSYGRYVPQPKPQHGYTAGQLTNRNKFVALHLDQARAKPVMLKHMSKAEQAVVNAAKPGLLHPKTETDWADAVAGALNLPEFQRGVQ